MPYQIELYRKNLSGTVTTTTVYDGAGAWDISLTTGGNDIGTLTFSIQRTSSAFTAIRQGVLLINTQVSLIHTYGRQASTRLFVGYVTGWEQDIDGVVTVTCKDDFFVLDNVHLRLVEGLEDTSMVLKNMAVATKDKYNASTYPAFTITAIKEVYGYTSSGAERYYTITDTSSSSNALGGRKHAISARQVMTFFEAFKAVAEDVGAVMRMEYVSFDERILVIAHPTTNPRAHVYEYGRSLLSCTVRYESDDYRNAVIPSGGTTLSRSGGTARGAKLSLGAMSGSSMISLTGTSSTAYVIGSGDAYLHKSVYYSIKSPKEINLQSGTVTKITVEPSVQDDAASGDSVSVITDAIMEEVPTKIPSVSTGIHTPDENGVGAHADRDVYLSGSGDVSRIRMEGELSDTSVVSPTRLLRLSYDEIDSYVRGTLLTRNIDVSFVEKGLTGEGYYGISETSHTYVGEVVHVTHEGIDVDDDLRVDAISLTIGSPQSYAYTVGKPRPTVTSKMRRLDAKLSGLG